MHGAGKCAFALGYRLNSVGRAERRQALRGIKEQAHTCVSQWHGCGTCCAWWAPASERQNQVNASIVLAQRMHL